MRWLQSVLDVPNSGSIANIRRILRPGWAVELRSRSSSAVAAKIRTALQRAFGPLRRAPSEHCEATDGATGNEKSPEIVVISGLLSTARPEGFEPPTS